MAYEKQTPERLSDIEDAIGLVVIALIANLLATIVVFIAVVA